MEELFKEENKQGGLFQEKKKKSFKKVFKTILIVLLIIILLSGSAYGVFYYLTEIKNRDARTDIIELAKNIDFDKYTDIEGLSAYFDNINANSYEFKVGLEANSHDLNNKVKDMTKNEDINIKDFKIDFDGAVDKKSNKLQTKVDLKHNETSLVNFEIQDTGEQILLYGDKFFKEHLGIEKNKLKSFIIKEYGLENDIAANIEDLTKVSLDRNYIKEINSILNSITKSFPASLEILTENNFKIQRNLKVNYRNNSLNADAYNINLTSQQYLSLIERLKTLSKVEANNASIELQSLVGKTDGMVDEILNYFTQMIRLKSNQDLNINIYKIKNNIVKIEFLKTNNTLENDDILESGKTSEGEETKNSVQDELAFEIEFVPDKNSNEVLISNDELKLKINITKDNNKVYTKIDIDGKVPLPAVLNTDENPVKELEDDKEIIETENNNSNNDNDNDNDQITGETNNFTTEAIISDPISSEVENNTNPDEDFNPDTPVSSEDPVSNENQGDENSNSQTNTDGTPDIMFKKDEDLLELDESTYTNKVELKANLNFDRPLNNSSAMNFNITYNSSEIELLAKANIEIKDEVTIENPMKKIVLTSMEAETLKKTMKVINEAIYSKFINILTKAKIIK